MGLKDKRQQIIKEVLQVGGALDSKIIKERVCVRLGIDPKEYPKATYLRHLKELVDDNEIILENPYGKNIYQLPYNGWDIVGQKYIENMGHRIFVPKAIRAAGVKIVPGYYKSSVDRPEIYLMMELGHAFFTLCLSIDAFPFNIHVSRTQLNYEKSKLITQFGSRTIFLEAMIRLLSGYKEEDPKKNGHLLLSFDNSGKLTLQDLGSTHGSSFTKLTPEEERLVMVLGNVSDQLTSRNYEDEKTTLSKKASIPLEQFNPVEVELPVRIKCSEEFTLTIMTNK